MVDFDLGMLYGVKTKVLNQSVKRNIKRFPDDFMFQLTEDDWNTLRSQIVTAKATENKAIALLRSQFVTTKDISKIRTLPYAFTRNGIGMLSSVLKRAGESFVVRSFFSYLLLCQNQFRSRKLKNVLVFFSLIRTFAVEKNITT